MKITAVNTYFVRPRWGFVEIETSEGLVGWGEAVLEGHAAAVLACVNEINGFYGSIYIFLSVFFRHLFSPSSLSIISPKNSFSLVSIHTVCPSKTEV